MPSGRTWFDATLVVLAIGLGLVGGFGPSDDRVASTLYFAALCVALVVLFSLGLRLPLHLRGGYALPAAAGIIVAALGLGLLANIALYRHDAHFDLTATGTYTPPQELETVARSLDRDVSVTYFYNSQDGSALAARDVLTATARRDPHLRVRVLDLDKELVAARDYGVRIYNTAVVESDGRHTETLGDPIATLEAPSAGVDRLQLAIEAIGYSDRALTMPTVSEIPTECAVLADIGPRSAYSSEEVALLKDYLERGGHLLLMYDPEFPATVELQGMLGEVGLEVGNGTVIDPANHAGTEQDKVAVPYYPPHPITDQVALTVFPAPRPIRLLRQTPGIQATSLLSTSQDSYVQASPTAPSAMASARPVGPAQGNSGPRGPV